MTDNRFKPSWNDQNLRSWEKKGITALCTIMKDGNIMSFQDLKERNGLENGDFYRYLQLRDYFMKELQYSKTLNGITDNDSSIRDTVLNHF